MRKYVNVVGIGERRSGISKNTEKPYDFTPVCFTYEDSFIRGLKCATVNISKDCLGEYVPAIGDMIEVVMREDFKTGRVYVDAVI